MIVDTHMHARSPGAPPFPLAASAPLPSPKFGGSVEELLAAMTACGVDAAVLVQWNSRHGFDNAYVADAVRRYPGTYAGVCSIDVAAADAPDRAQQWIAAGRMRGVRLFNGFAVPGSEHRIRIDDPRSLAVMDRAQALDVPVTVMSDPEGVSAIVSVARSRPELPLMLDHLARARNAEQLYPLADLANVSLKFSTGVLAMDRANSAEADDYAWERAMIENVVARFGAERLMWGSNYPQSEMPYADIVALAQTLLSDLGEQQRQLIMGANAQRFWPELDVRGGVT